MSSDRLNPRQWLIRFYMTAGGCFDAPSQRHLRIGRTLENHDARVAALCLAYDLEEGAPLPQTIYSAGLEWNH